MTARSLQLNANSALKTLHFPIPDEQVGLDSQQGISFLEESEHKERFFKLIRYFSPQKNTGFCGIASAVIVLNMLNFEAPEDEKLKPYKMITQDNIFQYLEKLTWLDVQKICFEGLSLVQLARSLKEIGAKVDTYYAETLNESRFRCLILKALDDPQEQVILNYSRLKLNQDGDAHFSPVAAYHKATDRFLILDVASFKYPSLWIKSADLYSAVKTKGSDGSDRGILVLRRYCRTYNRTNYLKSHNKNNAR